MNDRLKWRMWSTHAGRYFDENNDAMLENVFECMKQQICYDCQNPVLRKIYDRIAYNHIEDGMVFEQCTGLKDKNGKLIYEGDIIAKGSFIYNIKYHFDGFVAYDKDNRPFSIYGLFTFKICFGGWPKEETENTIEVIGNIHENKDLLEVDND